jgi:hypothetical protein
MLCFYLNLLFYVYTTFFFIASQEQTGTVATGSDNIGGKLSCFCIECIASLWPVLHLSFNGFANILC